MTNYFREEWLCTTKSRVGSASILPSGWEKTQKQQKAGMEDRNPRACRWRLEHPLASICIPLSPPKATVGEKSLAMGIMDRALKRTPKSVNFKYLPKPAHNSTSSGKNFIIAFTPPPLLSPSLPFSLPQITSCELREEVRKKEKKDRDALTHSKGPAKGKEKMDDKSIVNF